MIEMNRHCACFGLSTKLFLLIYTLSSWVGGFSLVVVVDRHQRLSTSDAFSRTRTFHANRIDYTYTYTYTYTHTTSSLSAASRWLPHLEVKTRLYSSSSSSSSSFDNLGEVGTGPNWIERSFPVETTEDAEIDPNQIDDYNVGISGISFQTGPLSKRMFDVMINQSRGRDRDRVGAMAAAVTSPEIRRAYKVLAMDFTAKEAVKAAFKQNGLDMALTEEDEQEQGMWADIDSIRLLPFENDNHEDHDLDDDQLFVQIDQRVYDSWEEVVDVWTPGQAFDFVARNVPAKMRRLSLDELLQALDPDGTLTQQAKEANMTLLGDESDEIQCLADLANDNVRRVEQAPRSAVPDEAAFAGDLRKRGYQPISASQLESVKQVKLDDPLLLHVMDALVSHGCLLVDLTDGGQTFERARIMHRMWKSCERFFDQVQGQRDQILSCLPGMTTAQETGSRHAKVGFAKYDGGNLQFLETRLQRGIINRTLLPEQAVPFLGEGGDDALKDAFDLVASVGKNVVGLAVAASILEAGAFSDSKDASHAGRRLANELLDDSKPLDTTEIDHQEGTVSMSPHRLCRYANERKPEGDGLSINGDEAAVSQPGSAPPATTQEIFGAHVDSSFLTVVPVASVAGLEVYDEAAEQWYRPELAARQAWQLEQQTQKQNDAQNDELPWHCRYLVLMPGELLQLATRDEIPAAVHRVVATKNRSARLSAPILLRGRPGTRWAAERYLGGIMLTDKLLQDSDGMSIEDIHDKMQPSSFQ